MVLLTSSRVVSSPRHFPYLCFRLLALRLWTICHCLVALEGILRISETHAPRTATLLGGDVHDACQSARDSEHSLMTDVGHVGNGGAR